MVWHRQLGCHLESLTYDFKTRTGRIEFPPLECCDMKSCIELFEGIDGGVRLIICVSGREVDFCYHRPFEEWRFVGPGEVLDFLKSNEG